MSTTSSKLRLARLSNDLTQTGKTHQALDHDPAGRVLPMTP